MLYNYYAIHNIKDFRRFVLLQTHAQLCSASSSVQLQTLYLSTLYVPSTMLACSDEIIIKILATTKHVECNCARTCVSEWKGLKLACFSSPIETYGSKTLEFIIQNYVVSWHSSNEYEKFKCHIHTVGKQG